VDDPRFSDVVDWIAEREGKSVYIEVGMNDPTLENAKFYPIAIHATLEAPNIGEDTGHGGRGLVYVKLKDGERNRLYIDQARVTDITIQPDALRVIFHDALYLGHCRRLGRTGPARQRP
jgi:hypothetical protein